LLTISGRELAGIWTERDCMSMAYAWHRRANLWPIAVREAIRGHQWTYLMPIRGHQRSSEAISGHTYGPSPVQRPAPSKRLREPLQR
jgi:hypothetical protein